MVDAGLVAAIAALHIYILVMEMFLWETPRVRRVFGMSAELAARTRVLAANQGLYNGFLSAGLVWALWLGVGGEGRGAALFFLGCVSVAGLYGAATVSLRIVFVQAVPAALAIGAVLAGFSSGLPSI